ncbi:MAG TPA: GNAT family N-acetyltransferase [Candidatus Acidoferrales bacterium]|nr:GNAT family N-acetyltransferase [Candidatus Acidoferrales bacterium]
MMFALRGQDFSTHPLTDADAPELQHLLERCADYFHVVLDRDPGPAEALAVFYAGPEEGKEPGDKVLVGITARDDNRLLGVLDAFRDYPESGVWYIGLLLFDPAARRAGLGASVLDALAQEAAAAGARELQLNVVEQNTLAFAFWKRHGFSERRRWPQHFGQRESVFIRMARSLP